MMLFVISIINNHTKIKNNQECSNVQTAKSSGIGGLLISRRIRGSEPNRLQDAQGRILKFFMFLAPNRHIDGNG